MPMRGRKPGFKGASKWGDGTKTKVIRVPAGSEEFIYRVLNDLPELVEGWKERSKDTRDWTQCNKLLSEIEQLLLGDEQ